MALNANLQADYVEPSRVEQPVDNNAPRFTPQVECSPLMVIARLKLSGVCRGHSAPQQQKAALQSPPQCFLKMLLPHHPAPQEFGSVARCETLSVFLCSGGCNR